MGLNAYFEGASLIGISLTGHSYSWTVVTMSSVEDVGDHGNTRRVHAYG